MFKNTNLNLNFPPVLVEHFVLMTQVIVGDKTASIGVDEMEICMRHFHIRLSRSCSSRGTCLNLECAERK